MKNEPKSPKMWASVGKIVVKKCIYHITNIVKTENVTFSVLIIYYIFCLKFIKAEFMFEIE